MTNILGKVAQKKKVIICLFQNGLFTGGIMWPSHAELFLVPLTAQKFYYDKVQFWRDKHYNIDLSCLTTQAVSTALSRPAFDYEIKPEDCLSSPARILELNLETVTLADLEIIASEFCFVARVAETMHGFGSWFDVTFDLPDETFQRVDLSTGPDSPLTHWKQDLFMFDEPVELEAGDKIRGAKPLNIIFLH